MTGCSVCGIPLSVAAREKCPSPSCPCYGTVAGSDEMSRRALAWRNRPSVAQSRSFSGAAALDALERQSWLEMTGATGEVIDIDVEHGRKLWSTGKGAAGSSGSAWR